MTATTAYRSVARPIPGGTYWAALASVGAEWTTVWGSYHGAQVDPAGVVRYGAALFTIEDAARAYLSEHGPTMAPGAEDQAPVVARVTYVGNGFFRTVPTAEVVTEGTPS